MVWREMESCVVRLWMCDGFAGNAGRVSSMVVTSVASSVKMLGVSSMLRRRGPKKHASVSGAVLDSVVGGGGCVLGALEVDGAFHCLMTMPESSPLAVAFRLRQARWLTRFCIRRRALLSFISVQDSGAVLDP